MPKILWTKTGIEAEITAALPALQHEFLEVIRTRVLPVAAFDLADSSLIFTSVNGVKGFVKNGFSFVSEDGKAAKIYCVGAKTQTELQKYKTQPEVTLRNGAELSDWLLQNVSGENFLHFCGNIALDILSQNPGGKDNSYHKIPVYETQLLCPKIHTEATATVFFSPSGVRSFFKHNSVKNSRVFSIGESTTLALRQLGVEAVLTSRESSLQDLISLVQQNFELNR